jgi:hypothetical protein
MTNLNKQNGSALITTLTMLTVMSVVAGSILGVVSQEYVLSKRMLAWNESLYSAECGVEKAWNELNRLTGINSNGTFASGWTYLGTNTWELTENNVAPLAGIEAGSAYTVTLNTNNWTIYSTGTASSPLIPQGVSRVVMILANPTHPFEWGLLAKQLVTFNNANPIVDSWNSNTDGNYSTTVRHANGYIGCNGPVIQGAGSDVYGSTMTGVNGTIDTGLTIMNLDQSKQRLYPNEETNGLQIYIPDVANPWNPVAPPNPIPAATGHGSNATIEFNLGGGTYQCGDGTADVSDAITAIGPGTVVIWVNSYKGAGGTDPDIVCSNGAQVIMYVSSSFDATGNFGTGARAKDLTIYGLPGCTDIKLGGNSTTSAAIYAPSATVDLKGTGDVFGSIVGKVISFGGTPNFHYDESLCTQGTIVGFSLVTYREN